MLWPRVSAAMEIQMFDELAVQDQRDYLEYLVDSAKRIFIEQGEMDLAGKLEQLFKKPRLGDSQSLGDAQFHENLARIPSSHTAVSDPI